MRLWGKVMSGSLLVFAAVFAGVGLFVAEARWVCLGAAAVCAAAALLGVPLVVRAFISITGDEDVLEHGLPGTATLLTIEPTGWRYNRYYPIVRFGPAKRGPRGRATPRWITRRTGASRSASGARAAPWAVTVSLRSRTLGAMDRNQSKRSAAQRAFRSS